MSDVREGQLIAERYRILRKLGAGGMGAVYLAEVLGVGSKVAVKFLSAQLSQDEGLVKRFRQEGKVSLEVTHPGAAQLLDAGQDDELLYLVFEFVDGEDLRAVLERERRLTFDEARTIALKVAEVLAFAHARGIVHRDIKPENIRVRRDLAGTHVKVLDFGIARLLETTAGRLTAEGSVTGTPRYMAPEQINGNGVDARADLYALGLVLFEMTSGLQAFGGSSVSQILMRQLSEPLPSVHQVDPSLDFPELDALLGRACAKSPDARFPDAVRFIEALRALPHKTLPPPTAASGVEPTLVSRALATPGPDASHNPLATTKAERALAPKAPPRGLAPWLVVGALLVAGLGFGAWRFLGAGSLAAAAGGCPQLAVYDAALTSLPVATLEDRVRHSRIMPPSGAKKQLDIIKASLSTTAADQRDCLYKASLIASLGGERAVLQTVPEQWGQWKTEDELRTLFLELPLKNPWTLEQRKNILTQIDTLFVANLRKDDPEDEGYWRRMYYGIEITCEVTDEALGRLETQRSKSCLNLSPR